MLKKQHKHKTPRQDRLWTGWSWNFPTHLQSRPKVGFFSLPLHKFLSSHNFCQVSWGTIGRQTFSGRSGDVCFGFKSGLWALLKTPVLSWRNIIVFVWRGTLIRFSQSISLGFALPIHLGTKGPKFMILKILITVRSRYSGTTLFKTSPSLRSSLPLF